MFESLLAMLLTTVPTQPGLVTAGRPAALRPIVEAAARCSDNPQLVIALTQFTPPTGGSANLVISLRTADGRTRELGQVGIFPQQSFSVALSEARRFGFAVPKAALGQGSTILVAVKAGEGPATGAKAVIGEARISPAPRDRC